MSQWSSSREAKANFIVYTARPCFTSQMSHRSLVVSTASSTSEVSNRYFPSAREELSILIPVYHPRNRLRSKERQRCSEGRGRAEVDDIFVKGVLASFLEMTRSLAHRESNWCALPYQEALTCGTCSRRGGSTLPSTSGTRRRRPSECVACIRGT